MKLKLWAGSRWNLPMPPSRLMSPAAWRFGVEAAARQFGLDFIRLLTEDYFFVCKRAFLETEPMQRVLDIMKGSEFHEAIAALSGYIAANTGAVSSVKDFLEKMNAGR